jgi:hypothetical protein
MVIDSKGGCERKGEWEWMRQARAKDVSSEGTWQQQKVVKVSI